MQQNFIDEVLRLTNEFRVQQGRKPLTLNVELNEAAQKHSESMANDDFFSHTGKSGDSVGQRATDAGYTWNRVGENIAAGQRTPADVVKGWINSPGHRANLLNPGFTDIGLGYFLLENDQGSINYNTYWTQVFGAGDSVPYEPKPTPPTKEEEPTPPPVTPDSEPSADELPAMEEPMAEDPMMDEPMMDEPAGEDPLDEAPAIEEPMAEEPAVEEPMADMPEVMEPANPMELMDPAAPMEPIKPNFPKSLHPVVRLSFEETSGRLAIDSSTAGMNNSGYLRRDAKRIEGKMGQAVGLDGVGDVVTLNNSKDINLDIHGQRTLSMWFNADDASADKKQVVYEEGGLTRGLNVYLEDGLLNVGGWNLPKGESGWDGSWLTTETGDVESGKWHHVALVLDGSDTLQNNAMTAYLDGEEIGSMDGSQLWRRAGRIGIGNVSGRTRFEDGMGQGRRSFGLAGGIDEVAIYNDALNADQVQQLAGGMG
ncbi:MAG: CAP domain-containing protein [Cyanobacteria bacterium P01_F01_bin.3]